MRDKLDQAIADFEDETLELSLGERINNLRNALMWNAFKAIKRVKLSGSKAAISEEEEYKQEECMRHFKVIESMYASEMKMNKILGKTSAETNNEFMKHIKDMKSSMGEITGRIPTNLPDGQQ